MTPKFCYLVIPQPARPLIGVREKKGEDDEREEETKERKGYEYVHLRVFFVCTENGEQVCMESFNSSSCGMGDNVGRPMSCNEATAVHYEITAGEQRANNFFL